MDDVTKLVGAVARDVRSGERDGKPIKQVVAKKHYATDVDDAWDALTTPTRLARWFTSVDGTLQLGGRYQLQGNAGGTITRCDKPHALDLTWEFGGGISWVEVRLASEATVALLTLTHILPIDDHFEKYGPGAVGVGWDLGLLGLELHLRSPDRSVKEEGEAWAVSEDGKRFIRGSSEDWVRAAIGDGAPESHARTVGKRTADFYTGEA